MKKSWEIPTLLPKRSSGCQSRGTTRCRRTGSRRQLQGSGERSGVLETAPHRHGGETPYRELGTGTASLHGATSAPIRKERRSLHHALAAGRQTSLNYTPQHPIAVRDITINKYRGQVHASRLPPLQKQPLQQKQLAGMKFYSGLIRTGLTSTDSRKRTGLYDFFFFPCLFCQSPWSFSSFGSSHPARLRQGPDLALCN